MVPRPEKYTVETSLSKKKLLKRLKGDLVEHKPSMNVLSVSRFMRINREKSIYYGRCSGDRVYIFYHKAKKRDGASTGFFGRITETKNGCELSGSFRKPMYAYVLAGLFVLACLLCALGTYAGGSAKGALIFILLGVVGAFAMMFDDHKKYLKGYLDGLSKAGGRRK